MLVQKSDITSVHLLPLNGHCANPYFILDSTFIIVFTTDLLVKNNDAVLHLLLVEVVAIEHPEELQDILVVLRARLISLRARAPLEILKHFH